MGKIAVGFSGARAKSLLRLGPMTSAGFFKGAATAHLGVMVTAAAVLGGGCGKPSCEETLTCPRSDGGTAGAGAGAGAAGGGGGTAGGGAGASSASGGTAGASMSMGGRGGSGGSSGATDAGRSGATSGATGGDAGSGGDRSGAGGTAGTLSEQPNAGAAGDGGDSCEGVTCCVPKKRRCDAASGVPQLCSDQGEWENQQTCRADQVCSGGTCLCRAEFTTCGDACVVLDSDPKHCGSCNHDCLGGDCSGGKCEPHEIASGQVLPHALVVDETHVYWIDRADGVGSIRRVSKAGGNVQTLATDEGNSGALAVADGQLYWGTTNTNEHGPVTSPSINQSNADGTNRTAFAAAPSDVDDIELSADVLFWDQHPAGGPVSFFSKALGSGATDPMLVLTDEDALGNFAVVGDCFFYLTHANGYAVNESCNRQAPVNRFASSDGAVTLSKNTADSTNIYLGADGRGLMRLPILGSAPAVNIVPGRRIRDLILDGDQIYYIEGDNEGAPACTNNWGTYRVTATSGATPVTLIPEPQDCPGYLAMDAKAIYWINSDSGSIALLAK